MSYSRLAADAERPKRVVDHTARWEQLVPVGGVNGQVQQRLQRFCEAKRLDPAALVTLNPRLKLDRDGGIWLAFAGHNRDGRVTAIKYRPLDGSSNDTRAEPPSVWLQPIIVGKQDSLDWFVAEG